jgi:undecaprenyl-diphosphatase
MGGYLAIGERVADPEPSPPQHRSPTTAGPAVWRRGARTAAAARRQGSVVSLVEALVLGVLQGVTEFLPISSSGHLALSQALLGQEPRSTLLFNVVVHLGTLCAILLVLRRRVAGLVRGLLSFLRPGAPAEALRTERRWIGLIVVASIPTALAGLALRDFVEVMNHRPVWIGCAFLTTMVLLICAERVQRRERGPESIGALDALCVGCAQSLGILPGISRSGATVTAALWRGARSDVAVELSILVSVPAIVGANALEALRPESALLGDALAPVALGFAAAFVTGIFALRALQWVVRQRRLLPFAFYCGLLGAGAIVVG